MSARTAHQIQQDIDAHLSNCPPCHLWFRTDEDFEDRQPCPVMDALHDEYDAKMRGGKCICYSELFDGCPRHGDDK